MLTTLVGGDVFEYRDASDNFIRIKVTGDAIIELIAGEVDVSLAEQPIILGDMPGQYVSSDAGKERSDVLGGVGGADGVEVVTSDPGFFGSFSPNPINVTNPSGFSGVVTSPGDGLSLEALAVSASGTTYAFNSGTSDASKQDTLVRLNNDDAQGTQVATVEGATLRDDVLSSLTQSLTQVNATAIDPFSGTIYAVSETSVSRLFRIDPTTGVTNFVGNLTNTTTGRPLNGVAAMAFNNSGQLLIAADDFDGNSTVDGSGIGVIVDNKTVFPTADPAIVRVDTSTATFTNGDVSPIINAAGEFVADFRAMAIDPSSGTVFLSSATTTNNITTYSLVTTPSPIAGSTVTATTIAAMGTLKIEGLAFSVDISNNSILVGLEKSLSDDSGVLTRLVRIATNNAVVTEISVPGTIGLARTTDSINDLSSYTTPGDSRPFIYGISNGAGATRVLRGSTVSVPYISGIGPTISAADFRPATGSSFDGQLYFVSTDSAIPKSTMYRMRVDLVGQAAIQNSIVAIPGNFGANAKNITGLVWDQTSSNSARLIAYDATTNALGEVNPDNTGTGGNVFTSGITLKDVAIATASDIEFAPDNPLAAEEFVYVTSGTGPTASLLRVRLDALGSTLPSRALEFGSLSDPDDPTPADQIRGEHIGDISWNGQILNPFTSELGVMLGTDTASDELVYIDTRNRFPRADAFAIYVSQASSDSSIVIGQIPYASFTPKKSPSIPDMTPFENNGGVLRVIDAQNPGSPRIQVAIPTDSGAVYIGGRTQFDLVDTEENEKDLPILNGTLETALGIRPQNLDELPDSVETVSAGILAGSNLLGYVSTSSDFGQRLLGQNLDLVRALAISRAGKTIAVDSDGRGTDGAFITGQADQVSVINTTTGRAGLPVSIFNTSTGDPIRGVSGLSWGDPTFGTTPQRLYAMYSLPSGGGSSTVLGTLNEVTGGFTPTAVASALANVRGIAFSPSPGSVAGKQGLYAIADPDGNGILTLFELIYTTDFQGIINGITSAISIGNLIDENNNAIDVGGMDFDVSSNTARLLINDRGRGRLVDLAFRRTTPANSLVIGANVRTVDGSLRATVSAIAYDAPNRRVLAIDTATGAPVLNDESNVVESDMLMYITGTTSDAPRGQNLDKVFVGGTVTGKVNLSGSIDTFYAGWLITGDANGMSQLGRADDPSIPDNFVVQGDIRNLISRSSIGSDSLDDDAPQYITGFDLKVNGKVGQVVSSLGGVSGSFAINNSADLLTDDLPLIQYEVETRQQFGKDNSGIHFEGSDPFYAPRPSLFDDAYNNDDFDSAQRVGTIRPAQGTFSLEDTVRIAGEISNIEGDDPVDYYAISLMGGQAVSVRLDLLGVPWDLQIGIFDPDGRLIETNYSNLEQRTIRELPINFVADRPGEYRIAVGQYGDTKFGRIDTTSSGSSGNDNTTTVDFSIAANMAYQIFVTNVGDLALGAIVGADNFYTNQDKATLNIANGSVGAITFGGSVLQQRLFGDTPDFIVASGDLRSINALSLGAEASSSTSGNTTTIVVDFSSAPTLSVPLGSIGLIKTESSMFFNADNPDAIGGDYQFLDAGEDFYANLIANRAIGTIRVGANVLFAPDFVVNADNVGDDGFIDLIDVTENFGDATTGGAHIVTGPGGNVRYMYVGGDVFQDTFFSSGANPDEFTLPAGQSYNFIDDSGGRITLAPTEAFEGIETVDPVTGETTTQTVFGSLKLRFYGIRGSGGSVLLSVESSTSVTVTGNSSGNGGPVEISRIITNAEGTPVVRIGGAFGEDENPDDEVDFGVGLGVLQLEVQVDADGNKIDTPTNTVSISSSDGTIVDVGDIVGGIFNAIKNNTGGEIVRIDAESIGSLVVVGSLGFAKSSTGAAVLPAANIGQSVTPGGGGGGTTTTQTYPFLDQKTGVFVTGDVVTITATGAIGNILVQGSIGTLIANSDRVNNNDVFEGIVGPIFTGEDMINVNIGEGLARTGAGEFAHSGLFAEGYIGTVTNQGLGSDIRGNIVSLVETVVNDGTGTSTEPIAGEGLASIGAINLTDGAIIDANIFVGEEFEESSDLWVDTYTLTGAVGNITLNGKGGIIGMSIAAISVGNTTVNGGFGILNSNYTDVGSSSSFGNTVADGYGIRNVDFNGGFKQGNITARGTGEVLDPSDFTFSVRPSEVVGVIGTPLNDLQTFLNTHSLRSLDSTDIDGVRRSVIDGSRRSGVIDNVHANGATDLGFVSAFQITSSEARLGADPTSFNFANSIKGISTLDVISDLNVVTGNLGTFTPGFDVIALNLTVAGNLTAIKITGDLRGNSQITAQGPNGNIGSITISPKLDRKGSLIGHIDANGRIGDVKIAGDLLGSIKVRAFTPGTLALKSLTLGGDFAGSLDINGNVGFIETAHDFGDIATNSTVLINGSLDALRVAVPKTGKPPAGEGGSLGVNLTVLGDVKSMSIRGQIEGHVFVKGGLETFVLNADAFNVGTSILDGDVIVLGPVKSMSVNGGSISGEFVAAQSIAQVTVVNAGINAGGSITSSLGSIGKTTFTGSTLGGTLSAPNGDIDSISIKNADLGPGANIVARNVKSIAVDGSVLAGAIIDVLGTLGGLTVGSDIQAGASVSAGQLSKITVGRDLLGNLAIGHVAAGVTISARRDFGGTTRIDSDTTITAGGSILSGTSVIVGGSLAVTARGSATGDFIADGEISRFSAASLSGAVIVAGFDIGSVDIAGAINNSLIQAGLTAGDDHIFSASAGGEDFNEDVRLSNIGKITADSVTNSIFAAGANFGSLSVRGDMTDSSASSGLVLGSRAVASVIADASPLSSLGEMSAARAGADRELLHGNFGTASALNFVNSDISAGVDAGADGNFGTGDDAVITAAGPNGLPSGGGSSAINSVRGNADSASAFVADSGVGGSPSGTVNSNVTYSLSQLTTHHSLPSRVDTADSAHAIEYALSGGLTITITVTGAGSVDAYDQQGIDSDGTIDTLVLSGTNKTTRITITGGGRIGRILSTDDSTAGSLTYDGTLVGDNTIDPDLWIDGGLDVLSIGTLGDGVVGQVGGDIKTLSIGNQGSGLVRVAGEVSSLNVTAGTGDPLLQRLGAYSSRSFNAVTANAVGSVYVHQNGVIYRVNPNTNNAILQTIPVFDGFSGNTVSLQGMDFASDGTLLGVGVTSSFSPTQLMGALVNSSTTASLSALAVSPTGRIFAIQHVDSNGDGFTDFDALVELNATTGALSQIGRIRDIYLNDFVDNFKQLAFAPNGTLYAITDDLDGSGGSFGRNAIDTDSLNGFGAALFRLSTTAVGGVVTASSPSSAFTTGVLLDGGAMTNRFTAFATDSSGTLWAVRRNVSDDGDELVVIDTDGTVTPIGGGIGSILLDTDGDGAGDAATDIRGIGFDTQGNLVALNNLGSSSQLISLSTIFIDNPTRFAQLTTPGSLSSSLDSFGIGFGVGSARTSFAYDFDDIAGGQVFRSTGNVLTLGTIATSGGAIGTFSQIRGLSQDAGGTPISTGIRGVVVDNSDSGDVFVLSVDGRLFRFDRTSGALRTNYPITFTQADSGKSASISSIAFDEATGELIGIDTQFNRLVTVNKVTGEVSARTQSGTALADLTNLAYDPATQRFLAFDNDAHRFVRLAGTKQADLNGIVAAAVGKLTISGDASYSSRVATNSGGFGSITIDETFTGSIFSSGEIGSFSFRGAPGEVFGGAIQALGDIGSASIQNANVIPSGILIAGGELGRFDHKGGTFNGVVQAQFAGSVSVAGEVGPDAVFVFADDAASTTFGAQFRGQFSAGSTSKAFSVKGIVGSGARITLNDNVKSLTLSGGMATNSTTLVNGNLGTLNLGGTFSGTFASRLGLGKATLGAVSGGTFTVGLGAQSIAVKGATINSVFDIGVWIGADGIFNTADDVITGGSVDSFTFSGNFTDSVLAAGVLPTAAHGAFIPGTSDNRYFTGNASSSNIVDVDSAQAGGAIRSGITKLTISGSVVSSSPGSGKLSAVVTADGVKSQTVRSFANALTSRVYKDVFGAPTVTSVKRINTIETDILFSEAIDSSTIVLSIDANNNGSVDDPADTRGTVLLVDENGNVLDDVTLRYSTVTSVNGTQTGLLRVIRSAGLPDAQITLFGEPLTGRAITDRSGLRSVLRDFNQNGTLELGEDRPQTTLDGNTDGQEGGNFSAILVSSTNSSPFANVNTVNVLSPVLNGPEVTVTGGITSETDADVYRFSGLAGQFASFEYEGQPAIVAAMFFQDNQGTVTSTDDTYEMVAAYSNSGFNGEVWQGFELPSDGNYFVVIAQDPNASYFPFLTNSYTVKVRVADTAAGLAAPTGSQIAFINNVDNIPKQLVYLDFDGGTTTRFTEVNGEEVTFSAFDAAELDSSLAAFTNVMINGDSNVMSIVQNMINIFLSTPASNPLGGLSAQLITNGDYSPFTNPNATGLFFTLTPPPTSVGPYTTLFLGSTDSPSVVVPGGLLLGLADGIDIANNNKENEAFIITGNFSGFSFAGTAVGRANEYSLAIANTAAHELGHVLGLNHQPTEGTGFLLVADDPDNNPLTPTDANRGAGLMAYPPIYYDFSFYSQLGTGAVAPSEFPLGQIDTADLLLHWLK